MTTARLASLGTLAFLLLLPVLQLRAQETGGDGDEEDFEEFDFSMKPRFSRPSSGIGIGLGFGLTGLKPSTLDPELGGDLIPTSLEVYVISSGLVIGGSWTTSTLYDAPANYDEFDFSYAGGLVGYDHSLFYGRMTLRASIFLGSMNVTLVKTRPDLTADTLLNPGGREVLERVWEDESFILRPSFGIGWSPIDFFQLRAEVGLLYPTGDGRWEDLREPVYNFQFVFGSNR